MSETADYIELGTERQKPRLDFTMYADIDLAIRKRWLVNAMLGAGELSCFFGPPGSGKSVLIGDLGAHVAAGRAWHGKRVDGGGVLYVAAERADLVKRRLAAFRSHHGIDSLPLAVVSGPVDLRNNQSDARLIVDYARKLEDQCTVSTRLVIVDTVSRALAGGDENSSKDMGALIGNLSLIQTSTGAHVAALHHIPADGTKRLRGHGALLGACDTTIRVEKVGSFRAATTDKANDGPEGEQIVFDLESVELHHDTETSITTDAPVVIPHDGDLPHQPARRKLSDRQKLALDALTEIVVEQGQPAPADFKLPMDVRVVERTQWHDELTRRGVLDTDAANPRADFKRLRDQLQSRRLIAERNSLIWSTSR